MKEALKLFRKNACLSQEGLAKKARVSRVYILQIESGRSQKPSAQVVYRLAKALGVKMEDFFEGIPYVPPERSLEDVSDLLGWAISELNKVQKKLKTKL